MFGKGKKNPRGGGRVKWAGSLLKVRLHTHSAVAAKQQWWQKTERTENTNAPHGGHRVETRYSVLLLHSAKGIRHLNICLFFLSLNFCSLLMPHQQTLQNALLSPCQASSVKIWNTNFSNETSLYIKQSHRSIFSSGFAGITNILALLPQAKRWHSMHATRKYIHLVWKTWIEN